MEALTVPAPPEAVLEPHALRLIGPEPEAPPVVLVAALIVPGERAVVCVPEALPPEVLI